MKKRCLRIALALAMVFTMLPMGITTAFAGTTHSYYSYNKCPDCGFGEFDDGECLACGASIPVTTCDGTGTDGCPYGGPGENGHDEGGHTHVWAKSYSSDDTYHWLACTGEGYETLKQDEAAHTWDNGTVTTEATFEAAGVMTYTCTVCEKTYTEEIAQLEHHYASDWTNDAKKHWHACTDEGYETLKQDEAAHIYGEWSSNGNGTKSRKCNICHYAQTVAESVETAFEKLLAQYPNMVAQLTIHTTDIDVPVMPASDGADCYLDEACDLQTSGSLVIYGSFGDLSAIGENNAEICLTTADGDVCYRVLYILSLADGDFDYQSYAGAMDADSFTGYLEACSACAVWSSSDIPAEQTKLITLAGLDSNLAIVACQVIE